MKNVRNMYMTTCHSGTAVSMTCRRQGIHENG